MHDGSAIWRDNVDQAADCQGSFEGLRPSDPEARFTTGQDNFTDNCMDVIAVPLLRLLIGLIDLYMWIVIISVIMSWLVAFNVINTSNRFVYMVMDLVYRATEPALNKIRRYMPNLGGLDLSPIVLIFILIFIKDLLFRVLLRFM